MNYVESEIPRSKAILPGCGTACGMYDVVVVVVWSAHLETKSSGEGGRESEREGGRESERESSRPPCQLVRVCLVCRSLRPSSPSSRRSIELTSLRKKAVEPGRPVGRREASEMEKNNVRES